MSYCLVGVVYAIYIVEEKHKLLSFLCFVKKPCIAFWFFLGGLNPPFVSLSMMDKEVMLKKPFRQIRQQCTECGYPFVHEVTITGRYEWVCPNCGLIIWEV